MELVKSSHSSWVNIPTRTVKAYPIHHDKFMVVDGLAVDALALNLVSRKVYSSAAHVQGGDLL